MSLSESGELVGGGDSGEAKRSFPPQGEDAARWFDYSMRYHQRRAVVGWGLQPRGESSCIIISLALMTAEVEL